MKASTGGTSSQSGPIRFTEQLRGPRARIEDLVVEMTPTPDENGTLHGWARSGQIYLDHDLGIIDGEPSRIRLFAADSTGGPTMSYELVARFPTGEQTVIGTKTLDRSARGWLPVKIWRQTSRLHLRSDGGFDATVRLGAPGFVVQVLGMRGRPVDLIRFGRSFIAGLVRTYWR